MPRVVGHPVVPLFSAVGAGGLVGFSGSVCLFCALFVTLGCRQPWLSRRVCDRAGVDGPPCVGGTRAAPQLARYICGVTWHGRGGGVFVIMLWRVFLCNYVSSLGIMERVTTNSSLLGWWQE